VQAGMIARTSTHDSAEIGVVQRMLVRVRQVLDLIGGHGATTDA
jgi:hypothetical protein